MKRTSSEAREWHQDVVEAIIQQLQTTRLERRVLTFRFNPESGSGREARYFSMDLDDCKTPEMTPAFKEALLRSCYDTSCYDSDLSGLKIPLNKEATVWSVSNRLGYRRGNYVLWLLEILLPEARWESCQVSGMLRRKKLADRLETLVFTCYDESSRKWNAMYNTFKTSKHPSLDLESEGCHVLELFEYTFPTKTFVCEEDGKTYYYTDTYETPHDGKTHYHYEWPPPSKIRDKLMQQLRANGHDKVEFAGLSKVFLEDADDVELLLFWFEKVVRTAHLAIEHMYRASVTLPVLVGSVVLAVDIWVVQSVVQ